VCKLLTSPAISIHGFYGHAGNSYGSTSLCEASSFLSVEVQTVNKAAEIVLGEISKQNSGTVHRSNPFVLSVGSTPTAHAASAEARQILSQTLHGNLELHAGKNTCSHHLVTSHFQVGNYPMLDLQQRHTTLISNAQIAQRVRATVISYYPGRGAGGRDEALVDAGAIAFSKDSGPSGDFGEVVGRSWRLVRVSQEHGILAETEPSADKTAKLEIGTVLDIIGQHACLISAVSEVRDRLRPCTKLFIDQAYPWYYVVDESVGGGREIVDIWVPWKGW
jgi:D-serine deaminase-like pyridoxal phosphate-dependent protein